MSKAQVAQEWEQYKKRFGKKYKDDQEEQMRKKYFLEAKKTVDRHNRKYEAGEVTFKMGLNQFADLSVDERTKYCGGKNTKKGK